MLWDSLIPRMQAKGLTVHDARGTLPRNGRWMGRPLSAITGISYHWDAEHRPHAYDTLARIIAQANYHINKDWGGGSHGDGLMYHFQVDNIGDLYVTRDFEDVLWSVGSLNYSYIAGCWHGLNQEPTREQIEAMQKISDVLCWETPEIPAGKDNLRGHQEVPGNATACNGTFLPPTIWYRDEENTHPERFTYDWPTEAPAPVPPPLPQPPTDNRPEWEKNDTDFKEEPKVRSMFINQDTSLFDIRTGNPTSSTYPRGMRIDNLVRETSVGSQVFWRTAYSAERDIWNGFKREHLSTEDPTIPPILPPIEDPVEPELIPLPQPEPIPGSPEPPYEPPKLSLDWQKLIKFLETLPTIGPMFNKKLPGGKAARTFLQTFFSVAGFIVGLPVAVPELQTFLNDTDFVLTLQTAIPVAAGVIAYIWNKLEQIRTQKKIK